MTAIVLTVLAVAAAGSSPGSWVAHPDGRIGPFRIDATPEAQIRAVLGTPLKVEKDFWPSKRGVYGRTLTYRCGPKCMTQYSINARTGKLSDFWSQSQRFVTEGGTRPGMTAREARARERKRLLPGCGFPRYPPPLGRAAHLRARDLPRKGGLDRLPRPAHRLLRGPLLTPEERADRLHAAISTTFEGFYSAVEGASFERREGHARLLFPAVPIAIFNGVVVESEPVSGIAESIQEVEEVGLRCGVQVREGSHPRVEEEVAQLGLTERVDMPGMTAAPEELADVQVPELEIVRVGDDEGLAEAARIAAEGGGAPLEYMQALYARGVVGLDGNRVYLGRVEGETVTTAIGYRTGGDVAIFSVATLPERRRRGYGAAITAHAARQGFEHGADLAWLQTSKIGESVYRRLGFRHVVMHLMLGRPRPHMVDR